MLLNLANTFLGSITMTKLPCGSLSELFLFRVPLQYLTGSAYWRDLVLAVGPGVLIPRPETELMVDFAEQAGPQAKLARDGARWMQ